MTGGPARPAPTWCSASPTAPWSRIVDGTVLADLVGVGAQVTVAAGGRGGLGNFALASARRIAPGFALLGEPGDAQDVVLELKSIADVALVGYPSAGKSSLVAAISAARPKIADYPFTTLVPNLGVVQAGTARYTVADVPGLIPGASEGRGLGLEFLRHIERCAVIVHVLDCATLEPDRDPISDLDVIEAELATYAGDLGIEGGRVPITERPQIVVLNKIDVPEARELAEMVKPDLEARGLRVFEVSTASHEGLKLLTYALGEIVDKARREAPEAREHARRPAAQGRRRRRVHGDAARGRRSGRVLLGARREARALGAARPTSPTTRPSATSRTGSRAWASRRSCSPRVRCPATRCASARSTTRSSSTGSRRS